MYIKFVTFVKPDCTTCPQFQKIATEEDLFEIRANNWTVLMGCPNCSVGSDDITLYKAKWMQEKQIGISFICKDCHDMFITSPEELVWLLERDLKVFKRCKDCRDRNAIKREAAEDRKRLEAGLEEAARVLEES